MRNALNNDGGRPMRHNPLLRLLAINWLIGAAISALMLAGLLYTDTAKLWTLVSGAADPIMPLVLLYLGLLVTLSSVCMGTAIMMLPYDRDDDDQGKGPHLPAELIPVRVRAK